MPSTTAASLAALRLPDDIETLASLPPSAEAIFQAATPTETFDAVDAVYGLWLAFIELPPETAVAGSQVADSAGITLLDDLLWARVLLRLGTYCATGLHRLLSDGLPRGKTLPPGIALPPMDAFLDSGIREDAPLYQQWAKVATGSYFHTVKSFYFLQNFNAVPLPQVVAVFEGVAHSALSRLVELSAGAPLRDEELLGRELTVRATRFASTVYEERLETTPKREPGIFSLIEPHEIVPLAGRDSAMAKKYGETKIARVLEQRLAIVLQSLGFYVVSARTGERTVDLVCIAADPGARYTLLVEAKSTKRAYGLPAADERALREYAATVKELLTTLPPLRAVVLIARAPARTLDQKLARLEASAGVPARFASAKSLVNLREELPGAAPSAVLLDALLQGPRVLPDDWGRAAVERYRDEQQAHETFVRTMFGLDRPG